MYKGLLLRKAVMLLNILLVLFAGWVGWKAYIAFGKMSANSGPSSTETQSVVIPEDLLAVAPRPDYDSINTSQLFGPAGQKRQEKQEAPPPPAQEDITETQLSLRLVGTLSAGPDDKAASAIIADENKRETKNYFIGNEIMPKVTLVAVSQRQARIMNGTVNPSKEETLSLDTEAVPGRAPLSRSTVAAAQKPSVSTGTPPTRVDINRSDLQTDIMENFDEISKLKVEQHTDSRGRVVGITAEGIGEFELTKKMGLQEGDVLVAINNEEVKSQAQIYEIAQKYQNSTNFRLRVLRDGRTHTITYTLD